MTTAGASGSSVLALNAEKRVPSVASRTISSLAASPDPPAIGGSGGRAVGS
jgi:hypothetical protein